MKHLEPQPQHSDKQSATSPPLRKGKLKVSLFIATLAFILGVGSVMTTLYDSSPSDDIPVSTRVQLVDEFATARPVKLIPVPAENIDIALDSMKLNATQRNALKNSLTSSLGNDHSKPTLGWVELWDFAAEDGDVVHISAAGYELDYPILNTPTRFAIPIDATSTVTISGVHDGGGGITLGIRSGAVDVFLPVIEPGQPLTVPITF